MRIAVIFIFIVGVLTAPLPSFPADDHETWNAYAIMPEDFKAPSAPTFEQHPVAVKFYGKPAPVDLKSHPEAKTWRTGLKEGAKEGPNFADHMTIAMWGCGTNCIAIAFSDANNGKVYFDKALESLAIVNVHDNEYDKVIDFKRNSNLLIVAGCPNEECESRRGVNYFLWTDTGLKEIYRVPRKWYPKMGLKGAFSDKGKGLRGKRSSEWCNLTK